MSINKELGPKTTVAQIVFHADVNDEEKMQALMALRKLGVVKVEDFYPRFGEPLHLLSLSPCTYFIDRVTIVLGTSHRQENTMRNFNAWADQLSTSFATAKNAQRDFDKLDVIEDRGTHMIWQRADGRFSNVVINPSSENIAFFIHNRVGAFGVAHSKAIGFTRHVEG